MVHSIVGFDVGNSSIKAGWFASAGVDDVRSALHHSSETMEEFVDLALAQRPFRHAVVATVHKPASDKLQEVLSKRRVTVLRSYESDGSLFAEGKIACAVDTPNTTGVDRLLACIAALERAGGQDVIVVTCGTAITVNLATADATFRGGAILPGLELMARSLHEGTTALPRITCPPVDQGAAARTEVLPVLPARSTISAMRAGVLYAAAGAIDRIIDEIRRSSAPQVVVHITGGDAKLIATALRTEAIYSSCLVLEGLRAVTRQHQS